jgi:hypothetical protein
MVSHSPDFPQQIVHWPCPLASCKSSCACLAYLMMSDRFAWPIKRDRLTISAPPRGMPPPVAMGEESEEGWRQLFARARAAGLDLQGLFGVTSDGCRGLLAYLRGGLTWVSQQRCVWHL